MLPSFGGRFATDQKGDGGGGPRAVFVVSKLAISRPLADQAKFAIHIRTMSTCGIRPAAS